MPDPTELQRIRQAAGITQCEAAVRARVSPPLCRAYERLGPVAVIDDQKRARLEAVYGALRIEAARRNAA